ncbi:MAG: signal peptidase I, signal peptidase I [Candidatus Woesebacteria bacterium GW2011_GWF1_31_35]|nr:MAG: signal peptidase I, signal peptidase I [Candidatus Woesebacteria bacterium GW2011_GWF1_31_35]HLD89694.1 signal peptidase I [Patescibacteria group bacterium]
MLKRLGAFFLDILEVVVLAVGIFLIVYLLILRPHKIKGASMEPNFPDGEYLLTEKVSYYTKEPQRGDVIVFKPPISEDEFIKRIIGLPGETVSIQNGKFLINDKELDEPYIKVDTNSGGFLKEGEKYLVPSGEYFVAGDNRPHSSDSRIWGPINKKVITGKAWVVYWPPKSTGLVQMPNY